MNFLYLLFLGPLTVLNMVSVGWDKHENDMQMRLCIVKQGVVSSMYVDFGVESGGVGVEMHVHAIFPWLRFIKGFLAQVPAY